MTISVSRQESFFWLEAGSRDSGLPDGDALRRVPLACLERVGACHVTTFRSDSLSLERSSSIDASDMRWKT